MLIAVAGVWVSGVVQALTVAYLVPLNVTSLKYIAVVVLFTGTAKVVSHLSIDFVRDMGPGFLLVTVT
jgi:hypothetical protein